MQGETDPLTKEQSPRWPDGIPPASVRVKLEGDFYDIVYGFHWPGLPSFTVTLMVHRDSFPPGWHSHAWVDKVGPNFIQKHFASSWKSIRSQVRDGDRSIVLYSRVDAGEDVTQ